MRTNYGDARDEHYRRIRLKLWLIVGLAIATVIMTFISFTIGAFRMPFDYCIDLFFGRIFDGPIGTIDERVIWEERVPRGLVAVFVGGGLAAAGCVMQSMLRNPLADPYTTGVSSGASFGAAIAIVLGVAIIPGDGSASIVSNAFVMSLIPAFIIMFISARCRITATTMILVGIGIMFMFGACTQLLQLMADPTEMERLYTWQLGTMTEVTVENLLIVSVTVVACILVLYRFKNSLNLMTLGDQPALTLGADPWRVRLICLIVISFMTAVCVSFTGTIGFVGLVAPQIIRIFIGSDVRYLIPCSAMFGALFLLVCDVASRVIGEAGLPVGIITAFVGSPLFLYLLVKQARRNKLRA